MEKRTFLKLLPAFAVSMSAALTMSAAVADEAPTEIRFAVILSAGIESSWDGTLISTLEAINTERPHGLEVTWQYTDPLWGDDAGDAMRLFAESGEYDVIWAHSTYSDQVAKLRDEFPEILFVVVGSGNTGLGGNQYWVYKRVHEAAYLLGQIAGSLTTTNTLGVIGTFPADDVNDEINAYFAGARSVNAEIQQKVAFIESWYDPGKSLEMTTAQISTGADIIFQMTGNFQPCETANILCFSNFGDDHAYSPTTILSSAMGSWRPDVTWIIDEWWAHKTEGTPYAGNTELHWFSMAEGGSMIAPFYDLADRIPDDVKAVIDATQAQIMDGSFVVPLDVSEPVSN